MTSTEILLLIITLLVIFQLKHFCADFLLQGKWMLQKFRPDWGFFFPLLAHAGVHGLFTLAICLWFAPHLWWLALVDLAVHFIMDRIKAGPNYLGRYKALSADEFKRVIDTYIHANNTDAKAYAKTRLRGNVLFWIAMGLDQMVHHLTHYVIIYIVTMNSIL